LNYCYSLSATNETPVCANAKVKSPIVYFITNDSFTEDTFFTRSRRSIDYMLIRWRKIILLQY